MNKYGSLNDIKEEDFPGFFTIKQFMILVDGCLTVPFYTRDKKNKLLNNEIS